MKKLLLILLAMVLLSCGGEYTKTEKERGPVLTEQVKVVCLVFTPSNHGSGLGISTGGHLSVVSVDIQEKYAVVFECQHGKFIIEHMPKAKQLFYALKLGQEYTCEYQEIFKVVNKYNDGKKVKELERHLVKYDFLGVK